MCSLMVLMNFDFALVLRGTDCDQVIMSPTVSPANVGICFFWIVLRNEMLSLSSEEAGSWLMLLAMDWRAGEKAILK
ncbi:hypothetical protein D7V77_01900 [Corallococcus sp. CA041A]|nr:hypothetical protein D7V77_01900 [Corallococcus sp. CA041A]